MINIGKPSVLSELDDDNGSLTYKGAPVGGGVQTVSAPPDLPADAQNGSVAVALMDDDSDAVLYPAQSAGEEVSIDIAGKNILVGTPDWNGTAISAAITAQDLPSGSVTILGNGTIGIGIVPVVADATNNDYTAAGITIDPTQAVIATATKNYAIGLTIVPGLVKPEKIIPVDADHVKMPFMAILAFENLTGDVYGLPGESMTAGWNVALATVDTATYSDISAIEIVTGVEINDYIALESEVSNTMAIEGVSGTVLFDGIIVGVPGQPAGLYVRLSGSWNRVAFAE